MDCFFVLKKVKLKKVYLKISKTGQKYYQLDVLEKRRKYSNILIFENRYKKFELINFNDYEYYSISGRVINLFGNKQILSVSKIEPLCENNNLGSYEEELHNKKWGLN